MKNILKISTFIITSVFLASCSSTMLVSSWKKQDYTPKKYQKILVLGVGKTTSGRAAAESAVANEFKKQGINVVTALEVFPNYNPEVKLEKSVITEKLKEKNIDGFLVLSVLDKKTEQVYVQGQTYSRPAGEVYHPNGYADQYYSYYGSYYGYYSTVYETVQEPGYYEDQTTYFLESNFYNVADESLTWSGQCHALDPSDIGTATQEWAKEIVYGMKKDNIFAP